MMDLSYLELDFQQVNFSTFILNLICTLNCISGHLNLIFINKELTSSVLLLEPLTLYTYYVQYSTSLHPMDDNQIIHLIAPKHSVKQIIAILLLLFYLYITPIISKFSNSI